MNQGSQNSPNIVLLRGAALWLLMALLLAWCLVGLGLGVPFVESDLSGKADEGSSGAHRFFIDDRVDTGILRGPGSAPLVGSLGDGNRRLCEFQSVFAGSDVSDIGSVFRPRGRLVPGDLSPLYFRQRYDDDLRIWGGGNHRLLVNIPPCTQRWFPQEMTSAQRPNRRHPIEPVLTAPAGCRQRHRSGHNKSTSCRCANRPETRHLLPGGGMRQANIRSVPGRRHLLPADSKG